MKKLVYIAIALVLSLTACFASAERTAQFSKKDTVSFVENGLVITGNLDIYCVNQPRVRDEIQANKVILYGSYMVAHTTSEGVPRIVVLPDTATCTVNSNFLH